MGRTLSFSPRILLLLLLTLTIGALGPGCEFFGKKEDASGNKTPGTLDTGTSIVGTWVYTAVKTAANRNPEYAMTQAYTFDPVGSVQLEIRDLHLNGVHCTGFGQYRIVGTEVIVYIQSSDSDQCPLAGIVRFSEVEMRGEYLKYTEPNSRAEVHLYRDRAPLQTVAGLWDFHSGGANANGDGGVDVLMLDTYGYFYLQTTLQASQYLFTGYYVVENATLVLNFFKSFDPAQLDGPPMVFNPFVTDGQVLEMLQSNDSGNVLYKGDRL